MTELVIKREVYIVELLAKQEKAAVEKDDLKRSLAACQGEGRQAINQLSAARSAVTELTDKLLRPSRLMLVKHLKLSATSAKRHNEGC